MTKQEQVEEMAEAVICAAILANAKIDDKVAINLKGFIDNLYNSGYRKVPDGSVIISAEERDEEMKACNEERAELEKEIERLKNLEKYHITCEDVNEYMKIARKEAVKEFAEKLKENLQKYIWHNNIPKCMFDQVIYELLKEYEK